MKLDPKAKKSYGQHFLIQQKIVDRIVDLILDQKSANILEVGPGKGALTEKLFNSPNNFLAIDADPEMVEYLLVKFPNQKNKLILADFLRFNLNSLFNEESFLLCGNFPYNISTQILFKVYEHKNLIPEVVGMFQKEVAERICSVPGKKAYGIQSVLLQSCYDCEYLFTVEPDVFNPPPKVKSGVIRLKLNRTKKIVSKESDFRRVVKSAFNQRRKTLKNALKQLTSVMNEKGEMPFASKRAEELHWTQFDELTQWFFT